VSVSPAPQSPLTVQQLKTYAEHCQRLVRDIDFILADQQLKDAGWTIIYAVDFSEIRYYVLPQPDFEPPPFFQDGWTGRASGDVAITQFNILQHFFATQRPLILAEPHAVELWSFYHALPQLVLSHIANGLLEAIDSVSRTLSSEDSRQIIEIAEDVEISGRSLTDQEINFIIDFFQQEAAHLVVFARGGELDPMARMNDLLENAPFVDLADFVEFDSNAVNDTLVEQRYKKLKMYRSRSPRKPAVSFSDALAVEHVRLANQVLEKEKKRILLLGRSKHVAKILEEEGVLWRPMGPIARHPRVFSRLYQPTADLNMPTLEQRKASLELLISSAATRAKREKSAHTESTTVQGSEYDLDPKELIEQIQTEWNVTNSLATALEKNDNSMPLTDHAATAAKLLEFLRNHKKLFDTAKERVAKLLAETTRKHEILAFQLQTDPTEMGRGDVKYRFEFQDRNITAMIDRLVGKSFVSGAEATEIFAAGLDSTSNYERLLAMAVSLGALGRWQLAEKAAGRAVLEAEAEGVSPHEGHFVKAVALRKQKNTPRRLADALADLDAATIERTQAGFSTPDPRYLKEEATIKLIWSQKTVETTEGVTYEDVYPPEASSALLKHALNLTTDQKLKVEILNNFCYLYATPPAMDVSLARHYLAELERTLMEWIPDRRSWPSPIRDTVAFTHFQLSPIETTDVSKFEELAKELNSILDTDLNYDDVQWVKTHRRTVDEAIAKKRGHTAAKPPI
jgi:hypothetical protein